MPIVITLKPTQDVYIGPHQVVLKTIVSPTAAVLELQGKEYAVGPDQWVTLMAGCFARLGQLREHWSAIPRREVRIQFDAPEQLVLRGTSYRNKKEPL